MTTEKVLPWAQTGRLFPQGLSCRSVTALTVAGFWWDTTEIPGKPQLKRPSCWFGPEPQGACSLAGEEESGPPAQDRAGASLRPHLHPVLQGKDRRCNVLGE